MTRVLFWRDSAVNSGPSSLLFGPSSGALIFGGTGPFVGSGTLDGLTYNTSGQLIFGGDGTAIFSAEAVVTPTQPPAFFYPAAQIGADPNYTPLYRRRRRETDTTTNAGPVFNWETVVASVPHPMQLAPLHARGYALFDHGPRAMTFVPGPTKRLFSVANRGSAEVNFTPAYGNGVFGYSEKPRMMVVEAEPGSRRFTVDESAVIGSLKKSTRRMLEEMRILELI